jgi:hypothetical protein
LRSWSPREPLPCAAGCLWLKVVAFGFLSVVGGRIGDMVSKPLPVCLEVGSKKVFASALDWPGLSRAGRDEGAALEALASYRPRYDKVAGRAGIAFPSAPFSVVQRLPGDANTDFGVPGRTAEAERQRITPAAAKRQAALVAAAWAMFDEVAAVAPEELRKGPRGGGRDRDKMVDHVLGAEAAYARKLGVRHKQPALGDTTAIVALRADLLAVMSAPSDGGPVVEKGWTVRYAARRIAWHVLDHLWEIQDRVP